MKQEFVSANPAAPFATGQLAVPGGRDHEALSLPLLRIDRGEGPRVLILAGCHGSEIEGPIVAQRVAEWLPSEQLRGRTTIVPVTNPPALAAWSRSSPVDGLNLNRVFPGSPDGAVSERIAYAISTTLVSTADIVIDLHSGGSNLAFAPSATIHRLDDGDLMNRTLATARSMGLPATVVWDEPDVHGMLDTFVESQGKVFICAELGGGTVTAENLAIGEAGVRNVLISLGMIAGQAQTPAFQGRQLGLVLETLASDYVRAASRGVFEPHCALLDEVKSGDVLGLLRPLTPWSRAPEPVRARTEGIALGLRSKLIVDANENLVILAHPMADGLTETRARGRR